MPHPAFGVDLVFQQICRQSDDWNNGTSSKMFRYHPTKLNNSKSVFPSCTPILTKGHLLVRFLTIISVFSLLLLAGLILGPVGLRAIIWQKPWHAWITDSCHLIPTDFGYFVWKYCKNTMHDWCMTLLYPWSWKDGNVSKLHSCSLVNSHFPRGNGTHAHAHRIRQSLSLTHTHTPWRLGTFFRHTNNRLTLYTLIFKAAEEQKRMRPLKSPLREILAHSNSLSL